MVNGFINSLPVSVEEGTTILKAAQSLGIKIPTLCYLENINEIGACRVCVVENKGTKKLLAACNTEFTEGMDILTNSPRVIEARRTNVALILSEHNTSCTTCLRSGNCTLQTLATELGLLDNDLDSEPSYEYWDASLPLVRDASKCIKCMRCVQVCEKVQNLGIWEAVGSGERLTVGLKDGLKLADTHCALCGQCVTHCPVGALTARDDTAKVLHALAGPERIAVVQVAPAVRSAWGELTGKGASEANEKRLAAALRRLGFKYVFDTNFSADLTIMEEGTEFLHRFTHRDEYAWPMFTSCCPGWVRFLKAEYPDMAKNLSTAKSPQQMFGAITKTYFAEKADLSADKIFSVSIMPCLAKKNEAKLPGMDASGYSDVDAVLTTRELARLIQAFGLDISTLPEEEFDSPLGTGTGAAVIFGTTGGVMEAALRSCYFLVNKANPPAEAFTAVRGVKEGWTEAEFSLGGAKVRTAVVNGLGNTRELMEAIRSGRVAYDFVEVMACPGGCVGGGGQPIHEGQECAAARSKVLYVYDEKNPLRFSHENPDVLGLYQEFLEEPNSEKAHHLLHSDHTDDWTMPSIM